jgi:hypothetical protein
MTTVILVCLALHEYQVSMRVSNITVGFMATRARRRAPLPLADALRDTAHRFRDGCVSSTVYMVYTVQVLIPEWGVGCRPGARFRSTHSAGLPASRESYREPGWEQGRQSHILTSLPAVQRAGLLRRLIVGEILALTYPGTLSKVLGRCPWHV